jgi:hypothetical protein
MNTLIAIAILCLVILFLLGRKALKAGRKAADDNTRIMDRHISPKP